MVDPLSYFPFQPVFHDWCNKDRGICYHVCGMMHIKEPLLLIGKSSPCGGSGFSFSLSEWFFTICLTPYNRKYNVLSASLNKTFPFFLHNPDFKSSSILKPNPNPDPKLAWSAARGESLTLSYLLERCLCFWCDVTITVSSTSSAKSRTPPSTQTMIIIVSTRNSSPLSLMMSA